MIENLPGEVWRDIKDYEGLYQVSNMGRILSIGGGWGRAKYSKILSPGIYRKSGSEYLTVGLQKDGSRWTAKVHRLVADAFIPNPENKPCINHIDNNPSNNKDWNLAWCTYSENAKHMHAQGRHIGKSSLKPEDVRYARFLKGKMLNRELAEFFGTTTRVLEGVNKNYQNII